MLYFHMLLKISIYIVSILQMTGTLHDALLVGLSNHKRGRQGTGLLLLADRRTAVCAITSQKEAVTLTRLSHVVCCLVLRRSATASQHLRLRRGLALSQEGHRRSLTASLGPVHSLIGMALTRKGRRLPCPPTKIHPLSPLLLSQFSTNLFFLTL